MGNGFPFDFYKQSQILHVSLDDVVYRPGEAVEDFLLQIDFLQPFMLYNHNVDGHPDIAEVAADPVVNSQPDDHQHAQEEALPAGGDIHGDVAEEITDHLG